jgi:DNA-binding NarL/FixJ family response regulator
MKVGVVPEEWRVRGPAVRVVLAMADADHRASMAEALESAGVPTLATVDSSDGAVAAVRDRHPDLLVLDLGLADHPLRSVARVVADHPDFPVVVLGDVTSHGLFLAAVAAGAVGYLPAEVDAPTLARTVRAVARGESSFPRRMVRHLADAYRRGRHHLAVPRFAEGVELSEREWEVLQLLWQGCSSTEIAEALFVSKATVRSHVAALLHHFGVAHRDDLLALLDEDWDTPAPPGS